MKERLKSFLSRKFIALLLIIILTTLLRFFGKISDSVFGDVFKFIILVYIAGNVAQKVLKINIKMKR